MRTVWTHSTGATPYVQRHLPTGGVELHWPLGGEPRLLAPLSGPVVEVIPARTVIIGVRFWPGANVLVPVALRELRDDGVGLRELGHRWVDPVGDAMMQAPTPGAALTVLQERLLAELRRSAPSDPLIGEAVRRLMPWDPVEVGTLADHLGLSVSQLRRRCVHAVGVGPKALQRALRFQGFLALAQAGAGGSGPGSRRDADGVAGLAADVGYADQPHLGRECLRLTGVTPGALLGGDVARCRCGHDHSASFRPFLATRRTPPLRA